MSKPLPVVVFSHGLGGSREAATYLGNYWAEHGYIGVFIQHPGSDESFWRTSFDPRTTDRSRLMAKFRLTDTKPEERRVAVDNITKSDQYLVILNGADHGVFGGRKRMMAKPQDEEFQEVTERVSTAFLDAYLKNDATAKTWLDRSAPSYVKPVGTYEVKKPR